MQIKYANEFKLEVYRSELLEKQRKIEQAFFYYPRKEKIPNYVMSYEEAIQLNEYYSMYYPNEYHCADLINRAIRKKSRRMKLWALRQLSVFDELYFVTINFNDETYQQGDLKKVAIRYLQQLNCNYFYCLGVGEETGRLHYHALTTQKPTRKEELFGWVHYEKVVDVNGIDKELYLEYLRKKIFDVEKERLLLNGVGQIARYMAYNSYYASLVLNKEQRVTYKENIKIIAPITSRG